MARTQYAAIVGRSAAAVANNYLQNGAAMPIDLTDEDRAAIRTLNAPAAL